MHAPHGVHARAGAQQRTMRGPAVQGQLPAWPCRASAAVLRPFWGQAGHSRACQARPCAHLRPAQPQVRDLLRAQGMAATHSLAGQAFAELQESDRAGLSPQDARAWAPVALGGLRSLRCRAARCAGVPLWRSTALPAPDSPADTERAWAGAGSAAAPPPLSSTLS